MADPWSLPREDLGRREDAESSAPEGFRPVPHERAQGAAARIRVALRRFVDLQFGSIWRDLAALLPRVQGTLADVGCGAQPFRDLLRPDVRYIGVDIEEAESRFGYAAAGRGTPGSGAAERSALGHAVRRTRPNFFLAKRISARRSSVPAKSAELAVRHADIGWIDVPIDVVIANVTVLLLAHPVSQPPHSHQIVRFVKPHAVVSVQTRAGQHFFGYRLQPRINDL